MPAYKCSSCPTVGKRNFNRHQREKSSPGMRCRHCLTLTVPHFSSLLITSHHSFSSSEVCCRLFVDLGPASVLRSSFIKTLNHAAVRASVLAKLFRQDSRSCCRSLTYRVRTAKLFRQDSRSCCCCRSLTSRIRAANFFHQDS
jgi:hypothetical protein